MTRARYIALAVLIGACWMGHSRALAQGGPDYSGFAVAPGEAFSPGEAPYLQGGVYPGQGNSPPLYYPGGPPAPQYAAPQDPYAQPVVGGEWYSGYQDGADAQPAGQQPFFSGGFFRLEYLNWTISKPGPVLLGAPIRGVGDPSQPQPFFDNGGALQAVAFVPNLGQINLKNLNGVRGTMDTDLFYGGTLEVSAFLLDRATSSIEYDGLYNNGTEVVTSTFFHGDLGDARNTNNLFAYNRQFKANYTSRLWSIEGNYLFDGDQEGFLQFRPMLGVRYYSVHEALTQEGTFTNTAIIAPDTISTIDTVAYNQLWGGQLGFRSELVTKYLVLGIEPKFALMGNAGTAQVTTNHFRSNLDPIVSTKENFLTFSTVFDGGTYARVNVTPNLSLRVGYSIMFVSRVSRPGSDIFYNDNGPTNPPAVVARKSFNDITVQGLTLGAELRY